METFDETVFSEKVGQITVLDKDTLKFNFYHGSILKKKWQSTAKNGMVYRRTQKRLMQTAQA